MSSGTDWLTDSDGVLQRTVATGSGSVDIHDGVPLDIFQHVDSDGDIRLSLQAATG